MGKIELERMVGRFLRRAQPPEGEPEEKIEEVEEKIDEHEEKLNEQEEKMDDLAEDVPGSAPAGSPEQDESLFQEVRELRRRLEELLDTSVGTQETIKNMMDLIVETNPNLMDRRIEKMKDRVRPDSTVTEQEFGIMSPGYY